MNYAELKAAAPRLFFEPLEVPVVVDGLEVKNKKALLRDDDRSFLNIVSKKYEPVSNASVIKHFVEIAEAANLEYSFVDPIALRNGATNYVTIDFPEKKIFVDGKDMSYLRGSLSNNFGDMLSAKLDMGFFRLWCSNGCGIFTKDTTQAFRHIGGINEKIVDGFKGFVENSFRVAQRFATDLTQMTFPDRETVNTVIESSAWLPKKHREAVSIEWKMGEMAASLSGWSIFNAMTKVATHQVRSFEQRQFYAKEIAKASRTWLSGDYPVAEKDVQ